MIVEVTADDIKQGGRYLANDCPVARALNRATGLNNCRVGQWMQYGNQAIPTPYLVYSAIIRFDSDGVMQPFSFEIPDYQYG